MGWVAHASSRPEARPGGDATIWQRPTELVRLRAPELRDVSRVTVLKWLEIQDADTKANAADGATAADGYLQAARSHDG